MNVKKITLFLSICLSYVPGTANGLGFPVYIIHDTHWLIPVSVGAVLMFSISYLLSASFVTFLHSPLLGIIFLFSYCYYLLK